MNPSARTLLLCTLVFASGSAFGNEPVDESENLAESEPDTGFVFETSTRATFAADADFDGDIGQFKFSKIEAGIKATRKVGDAGMISLDFEAGLINYDIKPSAISVAGDAASIGAGFDDVTQLSLMAIYADRTDEGSTWFIGAGVLSNSESNADFGDSIDGLITGGYIHKISNNLELGMGIAVRTRLDDDVLVVPVPQVKYTINEFWSIEGEGVGLKINYKATDSLTYGVLGKYESTTFRLDGSHAFAPKGMATHQSFPVSFYARYSPSNSVEISGRVGGILAGELDILNTAGNSVATQDIDTGVFGSINVSFKF